MDYQEAEENMAFDTSAMDLDDFDEISESYTSEMNSKEEPPKRSFVECKQRPQSVQGRPIPQKRFHSRIPVPSTAPSRSSARDRNVDSHDRSARPPKTPNTSSTVHSFSWQNSTSPRRHRLSFQEEQKISISRPNSPTQNQRALARPLTPTMDSRCISQKSRFNHQITLYKRHITEILKEKKLLETTHEKLNGLRMQILERNGGDPGEIPEIIVIIRLIENTKNGYPLSNKFEKTMDELRALSKQHHTLPSLAESKCRLLQQENNDLRDLIKESESTIAQKNSQSFEKIEQLQAKCLTLMEDNRRLQMQLDLVEKGTPNEKIIQQLNDQCNALRKQNEDISEQNEKRKEEHSALTSKVNEMESMCKQLEEQNLKLKKLLSSKENEMAEVKKDVIAANKESETTDDQVMKIQGLRFEINQLKEKLDVATSKNILLKETNSSLTNKVATLELEISNYESLLNSETSPRRLESKYKEAMEHIETLSDKLQGFDAIKSEKERLSGEVKALSGKLEELQSLVGEHERLESEHKTLKNNYKTALSMHHREKSEMQDEIEFLQQKTENYEASYQELMVKYAEMAQAFGTLKKKVSLSNEQPNYTQKIEALTQKYEAIVESRKQISKEKLELQIKVNELNEEAKQRRSGYTTTTTSDCDSYNSHPPWQKKAEKYDEKLKEIKALWEADKSKLNSLQTKYNRLERKVLEYETRIGMYKTIDNSLKDKSEEISNLKSMLKQAKTRYKNSKTT